MLQLFQPTNVTPDTRGSFGNGVVLVDTNAEADSVTVSWQVNGNTPMTGFKIDFTDMDGTALYSTGRLTNGCPFYPVDQEGEVQRFSYSVTQFDPSTSFLRQATEGLIRITQYWGFSLEHNIVQSSPSPYLVRSPLVPYFYQDSGSTVKKRTASFSGSFSGTNTDGLLWVRWVLKRSGTGQVVKDTGKIYGCVRLKFSYDGFLPGDYYLSLSGGTSAGVESAPYGKTVHVEYTEESSSVKVRARQACDGESAVEVRWNYPAYIPRAGSTGDYTLNSDRSYTLDADASMTWNKVSGYDMYFAPPWSFIWSGAIVSETTAVKPFVLGMQNGYTIEFRCNGASAVASRTIVLAVLENGTVKATVTLGTRFANGPAFVCLTQDRVFLQFNRSGVTTFADVSLGTAFAQTAITSVKIQGPSTMKFIKVVGHVIEGENDGETGGCGKGRERDPVSNYMGSEANARYDVETEFLVKFKSIQDWNGGNWSINQKLTGLNLYRKKAGEDILELAGYAGGITVRGMLDYGARSRGGPYTYYLYPLAENNLGGAPAISEEVSPSFVNWTVLSCIKHQGEYHVEKSFLFGMNLSSGAVSNNNRPNLLENFTPYPTVQLAPQNYRSGTLQSLIGTIDHSGGQEKYTDSVEMMDAIWELSTTTNYLFLKDRKGNLMMIRPNGEITMTTKDESVEQAQTVSFPWVEVADASEARIKSYLF